MFSKFSKAKYNARRLRPRAEDIVFNLCTHEIIDKEEGLCAICGTEVDLKYNFYQTGDIERAAETLINSLECMKMITNSCLSKKEKKAAQYYFDIIPLLKNITTLHDICSEALESASFDEVDVFDNSVMELGNYSNNPIDDEEEDDE